MVVGGPKIDKDKFLDILAIYGSNIDKWPDNLRKDMEEIFKSQPDLWDVLEEEKEFENQINNKDIEKMNKEK